MAVCNKVIVYVVKEAATEAWALRTTALTTLVDKR
jgi:hypothetical protein